METSNPELFIINDGYVYRRNRLYVAAKSTEAEEDDGSVAAIIVDKNWNTLEINDLVISVACLEVYGLGFFLGHSGTILVTGAGDIQLEHLPVSEKLGPALRLKNIHGELYACGMSGQAYVRRGGSWVLLDSKLIGTAQVDFQDIDGFGPDDLYCTTSFGEVYHFQGRQFVLVDFPSNRPLNAVRRIGVNEVIVCGDAGVAYRGNASGWTFVGDPDFTLTFWDAATYHDKLYLATSTEILVSDKGHLAPVNVDASGVMNCHRLHANDGVLVSFGTSCILAFDGYRWDRIL